MNDMALSHYGNWVGVAIWILIWEWATIPLLIIWPILVIVYYRLAKKEENDMINEFGNNYIAYRKKTGMFLPKISLKKDIQNIKTKL